MPSRPPSLMLPVDDLELTAGRRRIFSQGTRDTLLVLGDFNASIGTERDGYETCVGPHGSGNVNPNSTKFLDFARSHGLRVAGSWFQSPQAHRWTWYSNAGGVAKEIDHVLVDGRWRMIQNCRV